MANLGKLDPEQPTSVIQLLLSSLLNSSKGTLKPETECKIGGKQK
jgi:hypothetical protein